MRRFWTKILVLLCCVGCGTPQFNQAGWHTERRNNPANYFHKRNDITLSVSNDATNLYVEISSYSPATIQKMQELGISLWISKGKSPSKSYGIHYPLPYSDTKGQAALEGFQFANLVAMTLEEIAPIQLQSSFSEDKMVYELRIPFVELDLGLSDVFTIEIRSFANGKQEYLSALSAAEVIERRLDEYKANPVNTYNPNELVPFFETFRLAKMPNKVASCSE